MANKKQKQEPAAQASENIFEHEGKKYDVIIPKVFIPGIGERTAAEIALDEEAQEYLVKEKCVGSVLKEIV